MEQIIGQRRICTVVAALLLHACAEAPTASDRDSGQPAASAPAAQLAEPGTSLGFDWSTNGFEQVEARYRWSGSGVRDDVFQPNLSLSVPETDDVIWSSSCAAGGKVETRLYLAPPKGMERNQAKFRFETDQSAKILTYPARYVADGQYDGFEIVLSADDPMFAAMKAGKWAYIQIGEGSDAIKLRIPLAKAARALGAFLPACSRATQAAQPAAATVTASYACEDGRTITASYLGNDSATPVVRLAIGEEVLLLAQAVSGSGARYASNFSGKNIQWLTKADQGILILADAYGAAPSSEQIINCRAG
jgi:membrane-bound inhibitor of C-type lysozyme